MNTTKRIVSFILSLVMVLSLLPGQVFAAAETDRPVSELAGKTISILGASISTYAGISNNAEYNSTIGSNAVYYTEGRYGVYAEDTWWMQAAEDLGLRLLVNNSWSGSSLLYERSGTVGAYVDRCVQLHNNGGEEPDIIGIQMGTNDFQYYKDTLGTADIDYGALITGNETDGFTYAEPTTSLEAAAIVLHKISVRYPNAEVYYLNISQRVDGTDELIRSFNAELKQVVEHFGAHIVDIYGSAIIMENFDTYIGDGRVHPNKLGMDAYTEAFKRAVVANTEYALDTHTVSLDLEGVTADYGDDRIVVSGDAFRVSLTAADDLRVTVIMGGEDITAAAYADGTVSIDAVTGDVTVTAASVHAPECYHWEFDGTDLICTDESNALTKNGGTTADGVFSNTRYALTDAVVLKHDLPWTVEWKCEGTFQNSGSSSGARIFTSDDVNANYNARYIFKSNKNGLIAMGEKTASGSHNYGIALGDHGIDWTAEHTYLLENRIADDGGNTVYLWVDGAEIGAMDRYYVGTTDQNTTSDWISGKDFVFPYMGTDTHGFTNASIEYISVAECAHAYTPAVTPPTCTEGGYTTYTCECGDSYVGDYVDATGEHRYDDGVCVWCGVSILGGDWLTPKFAQGDYSMVIVPDTQILVEKWPQIYHNQMQWIADNKDALNIQAVLHMGDMVNTNNDTQWTVCEAGTDILETAGIPWMPMMGNHDNSAWFNRYYDYATYGTGQNWFGGSYEEGKLDHTYWFVTAGEREYLILSLGWAPSWDVLSWAQGVVEAHPGKSVILTCHAYMNKDGSLLAQGDSLSASTYKSGYPSGEDVWNAFKDYGNIVLAMGGHVHSADLVTWVGQNGAGEDVTSLLVDRQDDDISGRYAMVAVLTFHADSDTVDVNWYSTRYDALYREKNQFSITVPDVCEHNYTAAAVAATCTVGGGIKYTCTDCGYSYLDETSEALGHTFTGISAEPTCTMSGYTGDVCTVCGHVEKDLVEHDITEQFVWNEGYVISAKYGTMSADSNWVASDYVDISAYDAIEIVTGDTVNAGTTLGLAFYDANKTYISGVLHTDKTGTEYSVLVHDLEIPENAVYLRTTWYSVNHSSYPEGAVNHTFYCKGYNTEIPATGHSFEAGICETCGITRVDMTDRFADWTAGGPVLYRNGYGYGEPGYPDGSNVNLKYSGYISVEGFDMLELTVCARKGNTATGGYAFYTDKGVEYFISEGASARNGNGASAEGTVVHTVGIPEGAKYIRVTYWVDGVSYAQAVPFSCIGYAAVHTHTYTPAVTAPTCTEQGYTTYTCECGDSYVGDYVEPYGLHDVDTDKLCNTITVKPGQLDSSTDGDILDSDVYGFVVNYPLKKGHVLSISDTDFVFSVRKLENGTYSTMLKSATADSYTAAEDMTVAMLIRKPDRSALTAEELAGVVIYDSQFGMIGVEGSVRRFTVDAETIDGGTAATRAAIFLPDSYSDSGAPTRLIVMTNGLHGYLTDSVWNANTADDVGVMRHYMENGYAVVVVNNTADRINGAPDWGNPQLVDSYWKAYEYVQENLNVEEMFSIHSRSMGTFAAVRLMREHPERIKCALMCGAVLSLRSRFSTGPAHIARRYGFDDTTGATWEADKVVGYDPYTDVNGLEYDLPPTFWMLAEADATAAHLSVIGKIQNHGNDVTKTVYTDTDHSGVCRLNIEACRVDSLAFLEKYQDARPEHRFCAWQTVKEATCTEAGELRRTCADCSHYETMEIPALSGHVFESGGTVCSVCGLRFDVVCQEVGIIPGQFLNETGEWIASDNYGCVIGYELKAGHTLSISNTDYVFAVRVLEDGSYATMLREATADAFTADEDVTVAVRVRKPDKSALTEEELAAIVLYDTSYVEHTHTYTPTVTAPTCTEQGYTTYTCSCGDSYVADYTDCRPLNILMIGNSFSWDAADCGYGLTTSQTYSAMKSMLAEGYDVHLGVMYRGSATLAYHATCAMNHSGGYTYTEIGPETGYVWNPPSGGAQPNYILDHLNERDWDIIVIQAYQHEADGTEPRSTYTGGDARFEDPRDSVGYLLDYFAEHEPGAEVYYYMPWASVKFYGNDGTAAGYEAIAAYTAANVPNLAGTNSGKKFAGIIPVGTGIENARTTYLNSLKFSVSGSTPPEKEVQIGLLADTQHLSLGLGRYIAGMVVAETLIPQEMRKDDPEWPPVRDSYALGALPKEYSAVAQLAAGYAVEQPFRVTVLEGYETDPADRICDAIECAAYTAKGISDEAALLAYVQEVVNGYLTEAGDAESAVTLNHYMLTDGGIESLDAAVKIRVGYTERAAQIYVVDGQSHRFGEWMVESVPTPEHPGVNRQVCTVCGFEHTVEVEGSWQKYDLSAHLQDLPDGFCSGMNLWAELEPEKLMIDHLGNWVSAGAAVYSITVPVKPGDRVYANSFDVTGSRKGIQVSFIGDYGIVKTTFSSGTYQEFHANGGYLIAPEGAIAVNIPVWDVNDAANDVRILGYGHTYTPTVTAPTCTEQGYTTYICPCGDSYVGDYVDATGHVYENGTCTACGAADPDYATVVYGDANGDGTVNGKDLLMLRRYMANYDDETKTSTINVQAGADANGDGEVNGKDLLMLRRYMANYDDETQSSTIVLGPRN